MKTKIFNYAIAALLVIVACSTNAFAQVEPTLPPTPPENVTLEKDFDQAKFDKAMGELKVKMKELSKNMAKLSAEQTKLMNLKMKELNKDLSKNIHADLGTTFKDFGKNFAGSFNGIIPKGDYNFNYSYNGKKISDKEFAKRIASGELTEKVKNYSKTYSVNANDVLQISNSFGRVTVNTWNKNEFKVDVQMKFSAPSEQMVNEMINGSSIIDSKEGSVVSFKTNIYKYNNGRNDDNNMDINYTVYMPAGNAVNISNKFGDIILPDLSGKVTIKVQFGNLVAQRLSNAQNDVQIKFTQDKTSTIALFNGGRLKLDFSKLKAVVINNADATFNISDIDIDRLKGNTNNMSIKFGHGLNIASIDKDVEKIVLNASNTKVNLDFNDAQNFNFDVTTRFGSFKFDDDKVKITSKTPGDEERGWSSTKNYKGYIGRSGASNNIIVTARFADVNIK